MGRRSGGDRRRNGPTDLTQQALERLLEDTPEGIYRFRLEPEIGFEYLNRAITALTGFDAASFVTDPRVALQRVHPDDRHLVDELRLVPGGHPSGVELRWHHRDGRWVWLWVREVAVRDETGRVTVVHGAVSDVTSYKQLRAELDGADRDPMGPRQVTELRDAFLQAVSHELRTPLAGIVGFARMLDAHGEQMEPSARADAVSRLARNAQRLQTLVDDLLDVDLLGEGPMTAHRRVVDLQPLVRDIVDRLVAGTGAEVTVDVPLLQVTVDGPKVARIVSHLVRNAIRHTPRGTRVWVRADLLPDDGALELAVADDGPGIPAEARKVVLEPFTQGDGARHQASPGTGIGLALVARYARLHGGTVRVGERAGGGCEVLVALADARAVVDLTRVGEKDVTGGGD